MKISFLNTHWHSNERTNERASINPRYTNALKKISPVCSSGSLTKTAIPVSTSTWLINISSSPVVSYKLRFSTGFLYDISTCHIKSMTYLEIMSSELYGNVLGIFSLVRTYSENKNTIEACWIKKIFLDNSCSAQKMSKISTEILNVFDWLLLGFSRVSNNQSETGTRISAQLRHQHEIFVKRTMPF